MDSGLSRGRFWRCHLTGHFCLKCWRQVPSAPDFAAAWGCGLNSRLAQFLPSIEVFLLLLPILFALQPSTSALTPRLVSSSWTCPDCCLGLGFASCRFPLPCVVILPGSRATPFASELPPGISLLPRHL